MTSLKGDNWIYGDMTEEDYNKDRYEFSRAHNTTNCPEDAPFVIDR